MFPLTPHATEGRAVTCTQASALSASLNLTSLTLVDIMYSCVREMEREMEREGQREGEGEGGIERELNEEE